ncbi:FAD-dependent monooxygenase [Streptosporangium sp. NPDC051022]|uniref:FAD-dependent monooxygenase n=1 Tax=Streptosporangium sp. NPDC051022 TaxID=3155752 RepID=UPI0034320069
MEITFAEYFDYVHHDPVLPSPGAPGAPVAIVGGGPTGLALALGLARYGVASVVLEADDTVCSGSRAGAITRRTLEIFERLGVVDPVLAKGFAWSTGRTFLRDQEVFTLRMPTDDDQKYPPGMSLQQNYVEQYLLDEVERYPDLIEVRWQNSLTGLEAGPDGVRLSVSTPKGDYSMEAGYVVACDGGRSTVRAELGLEMHGTTHEGRYVIIDIRIDTEGFPIGRRCWFDPPSNPGSTLLMYTKPDNMVRFDYQLRPEEDAEEAMRPENVLPRVQRHLEMMGVTREWEPVWLSLYRAHAVTLDDYRHGRVLFAGDAAHLVPIFGVRGMNSSLDDAHNLAWKLALVVRGVATSALLDGYSGERVHAARENLRLASKGAEFMAPPTAPFRLMRDAVLSLSPGRPWITSLIDPRQHSAIPLYDSPLNAFPERSAEFADGPRPGDVLRECPLVLSGTGTHLTSLLGPHFTALCFTEDGTLSPGLGAVLAELAEGPVPFEARVISREAPAVPAAHDASGRLFSMYGARPGSVYLVRPDGHVSARWLLADPDELVAAVRLATV